MTRPAMFLVVVMLGSACGDDGMGNDASSTGTGTESTGAVTPLPTLDTTDPGTSTTDPQTSTDSGSTDTGMADSTGTETGTGTGTGGALDCDAIAPGPLAAEVVFEPGAVFDGSEDIAFDGQGHMAGKNGNMVVLVDPMGTEVDAWPDMGGTYGLRYRADGDLLAAKFMNGQIRVVQDGSTLVGMVGGVNGLYPDLEGSVWFTNFSEVQRVNPDDSVDPIVTGPDGGTANGVVYDPDRSLLFYTNYGPGLVRSVEIGGDGSPGTISMIASIPGANLDGLSLDACGNLYVVDQGGSALWRVNLDAAGAAIGDPEALIEQFPENVANAVFGTGEGWDPLSLYVAGVPGGVYRVEVGVPGAAYPTP